VLGCELLFLRKRSLLFSFISCRWGRRQSWVSKLRRAWRESNVLLLFFSAWGRNVPWPFKEGFGERVEFSDRFVTCHGRLRGNSSVVRKHGVIIT
jgi:hypothetical protein